MARIYNLSGKLNDEIIMLPTVTLPIDEYEYYVRRDEQIRILTDLAKKDKFIGLNDMFVILNMEELSDEESGEGCHMGMKCLILIRTI